MKSRLTDLAVPVIFVITGLISCSKSSSPNNNGSGSNPGDSTYTSSKYTVSTYVGNGIYKLHGPTGMAIDDIGVLYASETNNNDIVKIDPVAQTVSVLTASPNVTFPGNLWIDDNNNIYTGDYGDGHVKEINPSGSVTAVEYNNPNNVSMDPIGACVDNQGNIIIADNYGLFEIDHSTHDLSSLGTHGVQSKAVSDGDLGSASFSLISYITEDASQNIYIADAHRIRKISGGSVSTIAGSDQIGNADGTAANASFGGPMAICAASGNVYVADTYNNSVRELTGDGNVITLAGNAGKQGDVDGTGDVAQFYQPAGVAITGNTLYIADTGNNLIRKIVLP